MTAGKWVSWEAGKSKLRAAWRELAGTLRWPSKLEWRISRRYLRSRRNSRTASLNTVISTGGVAVGVTALIVVLGVMNGLRDDLRERILVANPHLRILTFGSGLRVDDWQKVLAQVQGQPGVVAASPEVISQAGITAGQGAPQRSRAHRAVRALCRWPRTGQRIQRAQRSGRPAETLRGADAAEGRG